MATRKVETENNAYDKKLEVYERLANISGTKTQLGFGPPLDREGGM